MESSFNFKRTFLLTMIVSLSISALIGIVIFLFGDFGETEGRLLMTTLTIGGYSLTGLCCSVLFEKKRFTGLAVAGMVASFLGFLFTVLVIWEALDMESEWTWKGIFLFLIVAFSTAHISLLLLIRSDRGLVKGALAATVAFISIVAAMLIWFAFTGFDIEEEFFYRLLGVFAILDVLGTIVTPILHKVYSGKE
jgi:hypothetical protein